MPLIPTCLKNLKENQKEIFDLKPQGSFVLKTCALYKLQDFRVLYS